MYYVSGMKSKIILRKVLAIFLSFLVLILNTYYLIPNTVLAATSPWTQTDWVGGSGQTSWLDNTKFDSSSSVTTSTAGQVTLQATSSWYNTSWAYRRKITFDNSAQAENLTNFPVLVKLDSTRVNYSNTQDSGQDIRFTDSDGTTLLSYEIEKWDETGSSFVWVKVPQIDASSATDNIYMYYGNSSATDGQAATSVWDSNFVAVYHMNQDPSGTAPQITDSTSNAKHGTTNGSMTSGDLVSGNIGPAINFDGTDDYITASLGTLNAPYSIEVWGYFDNLNQASGNYDYFIKLDHATDAGAVSMSRQAGGANPPAPVNTFYNYDGTDQRFGPLLTGQQWLHLVLQTTTSGNYTALYLDGASQTLDASVNQRDSTGLLTMGQFQVGNKHSLDGKISEIRISNAQRSSSWITASHKSEGDTLNTFASEEPQVQTSGSLTSSIFDTGYTAGAAWGTLTYNATTPSNTSVSVKARTSNDSEMSGATAFSSCDAITSASDISGNNCVTDSHRYIQYELTPANTDSVSTPTFGDISIAFSAYDATAPSISLTSLSPDPNNDNTPALSGTATDAVGTVSNVQFQMDSTAVSWTACTADDGTFDEAEEAFTCTVSTALSDGAHTMNVRATDSNSNTTASGSESSDAFTIDATAPVSIDLDSPGDNSYTNSERPTFKWKATTDATAGLSKYVLEIDNPSAGSGQPSGDFTIDDIPVSRTTDYETNKYLIHYENFSDSDSTNNYISVYTKSSSEWSTDSNSGQNDGKLREGRISWKVKARDSVGNETSSSRTLFVDRTSPSVEITQVNDTKYSSNGFTTNDKTPTIYGKITDSLVGDKTDNKVSAGPKSVEVKIEKKNNLGLYDLQTLATVNLNEIYWTSDGSKITDNSQNKADKYSTFGFTPSTELPLGNYRVIITGKDNADNSGSAGTFYLNIVTYEQVTTPEEKKIIEEEIKPLTPEQKEKIKQELEITKPVEPSALEKTGKQLSQASKNILNTTGNIIGGIFNGIGTGVKFTIDSTGKASAFVGDKTGQARAFVGHGVQTTFNAVGQGLAFAGEKIGQGVNNAGKAASNAAVAIGNGYNQLANNAPGVAKTILTGIGNGVSARANAIASATNVAANTTVKITQDTASVIGNTASSIASATSTVARNTGNFVEGVTNNIGNTTASITQNTAKTVGNIAHNTGSAIANATQNGVNSAKEGIGNMAFQVGEKTQGISETAGFALVKLGYLFVNEPTKIADVKVIKATSTSATIAWTTNHPANGKLNYGLTADYGQDIQAEKRVTYHEFTITNLKPNTTYYYEVMSHNKNYVYDANHTFVTPEE